MNTYPSDFNSTARNETDGSTAGDVKLQSILESAVDCIIIMDGHGDIQEFNAAAQHSFGYARDEVIGRELAEVIIPERLRDRHRQGFRRYLAEGKTTILGRRVEMPAMRADGSEFPAELTVTTASHAGQLFFTGYLRDITERQRSERQLRLRAAQQAVVADLGQGAATADLDDLLGSAVVQIAESLGSPLCEVLQLSAGGQHFDFRAGSGWPAGVLEHHRIGIKGQTGFTIETGEPVVVTDWDEETRFTPSPLQLEQNVSSGMSVVIRGAEGKPWGVLSTHSTFRDQFTAEDVSFLQAAANALTTAIQRSQWEQSLVASEARERARADELDTVMESVPAVVWIAHDRHATEVSGSRASYAFLNMPSGINQSQTAEPGVAPTHFQMYEHGRALEPHQLPVQRAARGARVTDCELEAWFNDGTRKVLFGSATPLYDREGHPRGSVAAFVDITARRDAEEQREHLHRRLDAEHRLMDQMLEQMPVGVIAVDATTGKGLFRNPQVEKITGLPAVDRPLERQDFHVKSKEGWWYTPDHWPLTRALRDGEATDAEEMEFIHPDGSMRSVSASAMAIRAAEGGHIVAAVTTFHDITERKRREEVAGFLAEATDLLNSSLEYERILERITHLAVPRLGDWCIVDIRESDGAHIRRFAAHADPDKIQLAQQIARGRLLERDAPRGVGRVMQTGEPEWESDISDDILVEAARDEEHLRILRQLGLRSYICVPIKRQETVLGALTLIAAESGPRDMESDVRLARELSSRVGLALDNARLYEQARREVDERQRAESELRDLNEELEQRVAQRTAEADQRASQLRQLTSELTQTEQRERRRLAQVLHDHLQQLLVAGTFEVGMAQANATGDVAAALGRLNDLLGQSIEECRSLTVELSPPVLYDAGLVAGLRWLGRWMEEQHGLAVDVAANEDVDPVGEDLRVLLFEGARELLFNVVKHAGVDRADLLVRREAGKIELLVIDAGQGFDSNAVEASSEPDQFGLLSIRERIIAYGGQLTIHSALNEGTRTMISVLEELPEQ